MADSQLSDLADSVVERVVISEGCLEHASDALTLRATMVALAPGLAVLLVASQYAALPVDTFAVGVAATVAIYEGGRAVERRITAARDERGCTCGEHGGLTAEPRDRPNASTRPTDAPERGHA
jgi:hypothetical protein